jgi:hypothetical protein
MLPTAREVKAARDGVLARLVVMGGVLLRAGQPLRHCLPSRWAFRLEYVSNGHLDGGIIAAERL